MVHCTNPILSDNWCNQPNFQPCGWRSISSIAITYQMQAHQWAKRENISIKSVRMM